MKKPLIQQMNNVILNDKTPVPVTAKALIATTQQGSVMLIWSEPDIIDFGIVADCYLNDYIEDLEAGKIFTCTVRWHSYQSNHPLDPIEYDTDVFFEDIREVLNRKTSGFNHTC